MGCHLCKFSRGDAMTYSMSCSYPTRKRFGRLKNWIVEKGNILLQTEKYRPDGRFMSSRYIGGYCVTDAPDGDFKSVRATETVANKNQGKEDLSMSGDEAVRDTDRCSLCSSDTLYGILDIPYDGSETYIEDDQLSSSSLLTSVTTVSFSNEYCPIEIEGSTTMSRYFSLGDNRLSSASSASSPSSLTVVTAAIFPQNDENDAISTLTNDFINDDLSFIENENAHERKQTFEKMKAMKDWEVRQDRRRRQREDQKRWDEEMKRADEDEEELLEIIEQLEAMV